MNSKSKIWQIVLLALLVIAIIAILLFNNKLNASRESLSNTIAQLTEDVIDSFRFISEQTLDSTAESISISPLLSRTLLSLRVLAVDSSNLLFDEGKNLITILIVTSSKHITNHFIHFTSRHS